MDSTRSTSAGAAADDTSTYACQWIDCDKLLTDPEALYNHLCNDHIGRKSTGNLCLTCKWKDCGVSCAKRDHITSHLRVHTPLKPHICEVCKKSFKRPQDLKKHEKIHTEEHHVQHKHSKAITVVDPAYTSRVRRDSMSKPSQETGQQDQSPTGHNPNRSDIMLVRAKSGSLPLSEDSAAMGALPTPSPELDQPRMPYPTNELTPSRSMYPMHNELPSWDTYPSDGPSVRSTQISGAKRSYNDYSVDDFFTDVKKRRVNPAYDPHMAARLNTLAYQQSLSSATGRPQLGPDPSEAPGFNPRSVSFDIRSPEELAAVNDFLITLGRDVANGAGGMRNPPPAPQPQPPPPPQQHIRPPHHLATPPDNGAQLQSYFDPESLSQLGLAGMPGIPSVPPSNPGSGAGYHGDAGYSNFDLHHVQAPYPSRATHHQVQSVQYGLYPSVPNIAANTPPYPPSGGTRVRTQRYSLSESTERYSSGALYPSVSAYSHQVPTNMHYLTPPLEQQQYSIASPLSSHSGMSTPPHVTTPPHAHSHAMPDGTATFDYLRPSRAPPAVQLAPMDYMAKNMRTMLPLKTAPGSVDVVASRPGPVEPKLGPGGVHRGLPAKLTREGVSSLPAPSDVALLSRSSAGSSSVKESGRLYPLLTSGDAQLKLPPLNARYRSPSSTPGSPIESAPSRATTSSPAPQPSRTSPHTHTANPKLAHSPSTSASSTPDRLPKLPSIHALAASAGHPGSAYPRTSSHTHTHSSPLARTVAAESRSPSPALYTEELARAVGRIALDSRGAREISPAQRRAHADLLRGLLVSINTEYRRRYGTPPPVASAGSWRDEARIHRREERDVEMIAV
ncbi:hypothetical protein OBBRIDRAFT_732486 [Obba rivulosa]|uniref:C2H2-type domain-containing protein n=1 Tax=Obba rivulosa TaxID=1052685 RepID=A0A8E2AUR0_9APHY|nr:hypothetical protein OBBRIDRAFT_732486 [Obba rivulosa]